MRLLPVLIVGGTAGIRGLGIRSRWSVHFRAFGFLGCNKTLCINPALERCRSRWRWFVLCVADWSLTRGKADSETNFAMQPHMPTGGELTRREVLSGHTNEGFSEVSSEKMHEEFQRSKFTCERALNSNGADAQPGAIMMRWKYERSKSSYTWGADT